MACLALPYFSQLSRKGYDFRKDVFNTKCTFSCFYNFFHNFFYGWKNSVCVTHVLSSVWQLAHVFVRFLIQFFPTYFNKSYQYKTARKFRPVEQSCSKWTDGQTCRSSQPLFANLRKCLKPTKNLRTVETRTQIQIRDTSWIRIWSVSRHTGSPVSSYAVWYESGQLSRFVISLLT